jgi:hypothetical protein
MHAEALILWHGTLACVLLALRTPPRYTSYGLSCIGGIWPPTQWTG